MTIIEKAAYLKGLADGLGVDPASREGKLWAALNDLLTDMAREIEDLHNTDMVQADMLDDIAEELGYLEELTDGLEMPERDEDEEEDEPEFDGVIYDATCPVCGEEISFDEDTLEQGSIQCPNCGETLEFDLGGEGEKE